MLPAHAPRLPAILTPLLLAALAPLAGRADPQETKPEEENLLANPEPPPPAEEKETPQRPPDETFGTALSLLNLQAEWSGYGDVLFLLEPGARPTFEAAHFNPILTARMGERLSAELEVEIEPDEVGAEYAIVDVSVSRALTFRVGKFLVPFGYFNEVLHPSFRWNMVTKPLMMNEALPATWTDVGVQVRGTIDLGKAAGLSYAAYVVNGLGGGAEYLTETQVVRSLREIPADNNDDKAFGARLAVELLRGQTVGALRLGVSAYTGAVNPDSTDRLSLAGVDASIQLGPVVLRAEASQSFLGPNAEPLRPFERGIYAQAGYRFQKLEVSGRYDYVELRPAGAEPAGQHQVALALGYALNTFFSLRAEGALPIASVENRPPRLALMTAFSF